MNALTQILKYKIVAIIRGVESANVFPIVQALYEGGIRIVEITLNSERAYELIGELSSVMKEMLVGAGTVLDLPSARTAILHGAQFIISPSTDIEVIKYVKQQKRVSIPGAFTATEIVTAYQAGADIIKVFPVPGPQYILDLRGPLSHIPFMPTGRIDADNISEFQKAGAVAFGVGSSLVKAGQQITGDALQQLTARAAQLVLTIKNTSGIN
jgi:2-dehydro-3-deoxyphosphogluconate aldolase / (4S)-4-hydroxy-2-oxoglutarate aldolase